MPNTNHMQGESMYFEELNVPQNHIYLFKPQIYQTWEDCPKMNVV